MRLRTAGNIFFAICLFTATFYVPGVGSIKPASAAALDCNKVSAKPPPLSKVHKCAPNWYAYRMVVFALYQVGSPYSADECRFGMYSNLKKSNSSPIVNFPQHAPCSGPWHYDCSGLVFSASHFAGRDLGLKDRTTSSFLMDKRLKFRKLQDAKPGDLLYFETGDPNSIYGLGHMGIVYAPGWVINATARASQGHRVVLERYIGPGRDPHMGKVFPKVQYLPGNWA